MKKTLLLFALLVANVTFLLAQSSLQLIDEAGNAVEPDAVFKVRSTDLHEWQIETAPFSVKNISAADVTVQLKRETIEAVEGTTNDFCFAGNCFSSSVDFAVPLAGLTIAAGATTATIDAFTAHYQPYEQEGITLVKYTFFNMADENDAVSIIVDYYVGPNVGITEYDSEATLSAYPNPVSDMITIDYSVKTQKNVRLAIYSINGQKQYEQSLQSAESTVIVSVADYPKGVYLYRIEGDDYQTKYAKIVVQ